MGDGFQLRDRAYLDLLHHGLVLLRNFAHDGRVELCRIEADHLHEVPTLIGEINEHRHLYYLRGTRTLYLQQLKGLGAADYLEQVGIWYTQAWQVLAATAGCESATEKQDIRMPDPAPIQVFELTMDNTEDQDDLNRRLRKPGESDCGADAVIGGPASASTVDAAEKENRAS
jgi:hypothetical protein